MKEPGSDRKKLRQKAFDYLARREYGVNELARKLVQRGFDEQLTAEVIGELASSSLVSDERFIESLLLSLQRRGFGLTGPDRQLPGVLAVHSSQRFAGGRDSFESRRRVHNLLEVEGKYRLERRRAHRSST